jgi:hypothetical protein
MSAPPKENAADRQDLQREGVSKQLPPRSQTRRVSAAEGGLP